MSNTQLQIRPATVADAAVMVTILHAAFEEYRGKLDPPSGAHRETLESVLNLLAHEHGLLALCDGRAVGWHWSTLWKPAPKSLAKPKSR